MSHEQFTRGDLACNRGVTLFCRRDMSPQFKLIWIQRTCRGDKISSPQQDFSWKSSVHTMGFVPATCPCNMSPRVSWPLQCKGGCTIFHAQPANHQCSNKGPEQWTAQSIYHFKADILLPRSRKDHPFMTEQFCSGESTVPGSGLPVTNIPLFTSIHLGGGKHLKSFEKLNLVYTGNDHTLSWAKSGHLCEITEPLMKKEGSNKSGRHWSKLDLRFAMLLTNIKLWLTLSYTSTDRLLWFES